jgi:hypothetical protein
MQKKNPPSLVSELSNFYAVYDLKLCVYGALGSSIIAMDFEIREEARFENDLKMLLIKMGLSGCLMVVPVGRIDFGFFS